MKSAAVPIIAACLLVVATTVVQGRWTDRWSGRNVGEELRERSAALEKNFPKEFGSWEFVQELESDPKELQRAGAVGHVSRLYRDTETNAKVSAFVVCATPHDASGHTPDRCYPGAGFEIAESEHRESIPLTTGRSAETFTGTFRKTGQTLRVFWTYGGDGRWIAPQIARIELAGRGAIYKLYAIIDETRLGDGQAKSICADFLSALLPEIDRLVGVEAAEKPQPGADASASR
jgi:hypothetical protein